MIIDEQYVEVFLAVAVCMASGLILRASLSLAGQVWVRTYHHTLTYVLLPVVTLVVTKVIAGNVALSLGMIGALSIVRFRNPVKNPLELVIFFALLSIGIAAGVDLRWALLLLGVSTFVVIAAYALERILGATGRSVFSLSFDEGVPLTLLEFSSSEEIPDIEALNAVQVYSFSGEPRVHRYKLAFRSRREADRVRDLLSKRKVDDLQIRYAGDG